MKSLSYFLNALYNTSFKKYAKHFLFKEFEANNTGFYKIRAQNEIGISNVNINLNTEMYYIQFFFNNLNCLFIFYWLYKAKS